MEKDLIRYFIAETNNRFDRLDKKVDKLLEFKWQIIGGSVVASLVITGILNIVIYVIKQ